MMTIKNSKKYFFFKCCFVMPSNNLKKLKNVDNFRENECSLKKLSCILSYIFNGESGSSYFNYTQNLSKYIWLCNIKLKILIKYSHLY